MSNNAKIYGAWNENCNRFHIFLFFPPIKKIPPYFVNFYEPNFFTLPTIYKSWRSCNVNEIGKYVKGGSSCDVFIRAPF